MCTLVIQRRPGAAYPFVVAANRDERRDRPASPPLLWREPGILAPRDERAGGTWLGLNRHGVFAAVTNRFPAPRFEERASRGQLVVEALRERTAEAAHERLARVDPARFNAFHLVCGDAEAAFVTWSDGAELQRAPLPAGLSVVCERSFSGPAPERERLVRAEWPERGVDAPGDVPSLQALLGLRSAGDPFDAPCVDVPELGYGTRSALVLLLREPLTESRWWWNDGSPDRHAWREQPELVRALADPPA